MTLTLKNKPVISATASVVGPKEGEGPLARYFDKVSQDILFGSKTWEQAESQIVLEALKLVVQKDGSQLDDIDYVLAGDLQNQATGTSFGVRELGRPFFGLFGACSTMGEAMSLGSILVDGGYAGKVTASASSHFCAAEKNFRYPLELGTQRPLTSTWTVTGCGACVISKEGTGPRITAVTTGKIVDMGVKDANNMGAAMAPAAADLMATHFRDLGRKPEYYDMIFTGDLGEVGRELCIKLMKDEGFSLGENYFDCGVQIFDKNSQDTHAGGSGCACSAVTFAGWLFSEMKAKKLNKLLFIPTGALLSQTSTLQGESIPAIAHGVVIEND